MFKISDWKDKWTFDFRNRIKSVKYKGNKVIVSGGLFRTSLGYSRFGKKMTFKISKKCKFYKNNKRISKRKFKKNTSPLRKNNHFTIRVKNKRVVKLMYFTYVMC